MILSEVKKFESLFENKQTQDDMNQVINYIKPISKYNYKLLYIYLDIKHENPEAYCPPSGSYT